VLPPPLPPPPPPGKPVRPKIDGFAIASFIFGAIGGVLLGLIFGVVALRRIRRDKKRGRGLAIAGIASSCAWVVLVALGAFLVAVNDAQRSPSGAVTGAGDVSVFQLRIGDCITSVPTGETFTVEVTPCSNPHVGEIFEVGYLPAGPWPGADEVDRLAEGLCIKAFQPYVAASIDDSPYAVSFLQPLESSWSEDRGVVCIAHDPSEKPLVGSIRGQGSENP
jgi:hypothetical protein